MVSLLGLSTLQLNLSDVVLYESLEEGEYWTRDLRSDLQTR